MFRVSEEMEKWRIIGGPERTSRGDPFGKFTFAVSPEGVKYYPEHSPASWRVWRIIATDGLMRNDPGTPADLAALPAWEHVSVSILRRDKRKLVLPTWTEMCRVKDWFWEPEDAVVQFHPPERQYISQADCLHLWRPVDELLPLPPLVLVGTEVTGAKI